MNKISVFILCLLLFSAELQSAENVITMGYKGVERVPLMEAEPSIDGLYYELYSTAAQRIGYTLSIVRGPKKRIYQELKAGEIDFYPGASISVARSAFLYYFKNGLQAGHAGLSLEDLPDITHLSQLNGLLLKQLGGHDFLYGIDGVKTKEVPKLTIEKAVQLLRARRAELFIYDRSSLEYYIKIHGEDGLKIHPDAYKGEEPMYLGFSLNSKYYQGEENPEFKSDEPLSLSNYPHSLSEDSVAYKFGEALQQMSQEGITQQLYEKYYR